MILDEVHLYRSTLYSKVLFLSKYDYVIGLSATPFSGMSNNKVNQFMIGMMFSIVISNDASEFPKNTTWIEPLVEIET